MTISLATSHQARGRRADCAQASAVKLGRSRGRRDYHVLVVEDEKNVAKSLGFLLGGRYHVQTVGKGSEAIDTVKHSHVDLMLLDIRLPDTSGVAVLKEARKLAPAIDVIMLTAVRDVQTVVECMKVGALDYVQKPFEKEELLVCVQQAYEKHLLRSEVARLRSELYEPFRFSNIVAVSSSMRNVIDIARKMSQVDVNVLITGESGTGKELFARAIHCEGKRWAGPFVALNCARYTGTLLDSELFGHEKGAFTGAHQSRRGRFEMADGGTLFLDEVVTAQPDTQSRLLRVIEEKCFERVGGEETVPIDVRIIAATNADLAAAVAVDTFREDLYYRLNVAPIELPPLRARREDIPVLAEFFLEKQFAKTGRRFQGLTDDAMRTLMLHDWRGNVRELESLIQMACALEDGEWITVRHFTNDVMRSAVLSTDQPGCRLAEAVGQFERAFLISELRTNGWNRRRTARELGVHRNTIEKKMAKYGITPEGESAVGLRAGG